MERLLAMLLEWVSFWIDTFVGVVGGAVGYLAWPAQAVGLPAEIFGAALLCAALVAMWRAMGGYLT